MLATLVQGRERRLSVLIFHRVTPEPDPLFPGEMHAERFDALVRMLAADFNVLPLEGAIERIANDDLPPRAVSITFDDGYADNYTVACPILKRHGAVATFFIASGFLDGGTMWNDQVIEAVRASDRHELDLGWLEAGTVALGPSHARRAAIDSILQRIKYLPPSKRADAVARVRAAAGNPPCPRLMLESAQVRALADEGMDIGGHTLTHPILAVLAPEEALREIRGDRERIDGIIGRPPRLFAYPNGKPRADYARAHVDMVRGAGYAGAVSTARGSAGPESDRYQIPRFTPWDASSLRFGLRLAQNYRRRHAELA
ncbi:MAG: polysaccharide deacetylase family protein [Burkholderiales bacterium]|nr:polysaccharide deacetylase family protein [Burkholderiales bacterium]